jgi:hypothetical protein
MVLKSLRHGFAGTCDLVIDDAAEVWVVDLKSRKAGLGAYLTDHIQCDGYAIAYEEQTGEKVAGTAVLIVREDGSWSLEDNPLPKGIFLDTLRLYRKMKGGD